MRKVLILVTMALLTAGVLAAGKTSEWYSTSGNVVHIINSDSMQFTIKVYPQQGPTMVCRAEWIDQNTFTYNMNDGGSAFMGTFTDGGWAIRVTGRGRTNTWRFNRWL